MEKLNIQINHNTVGVALVVSNDYKPLGPDFELNTHGDSDTMEQLFKKFGYDVHKIRNLSKAKHFLSYCKDLAAFKYPSTCKRLLVYFAGHGGDGTLLMQDGRSKVEIEDMINDFKLNDQNNNPVLSEMAKMFFFDACRGEKEDKGYTGRSAIRNDREKIGCQVRSRKVKPVEGNILVANASTRYYVADEGEAGGSWTNCLAKALRESKESHSVLDVLNIVSDLLRAEDHGDRVQTSEFTNSIGAENMVYFRKEARQRGKLFLNTLAIGH